MTTQTERLAQINSSWEEWSPNAEAASREGWTVSECDSENDTPFQLQALDEVGIFESDDHAWTHVVTNARNGDVLALKALAFIRNCSPNEYEFIVKACGNLPV